MGENKEGNTIRLYENRWRTMADKLAIRFHSDGLIGEALLAYGIQLSIDYGYGGAIYLKAKTSEIREHYIRDFGAIPFSRLDPYLLLIDGEAARELFSQYLKEE